MLDKVSGQRINISSAARDGALGGTLPACQIRCLKCENAGADDDSWTRSLTTIPCFPAREQTCCSGYQICRRERRLPQPIYKVKSPVTAYACRYGTYNKPCGPRGRVGGSAASALWRSSARAAPATRPGDYANLRFLAGVVPTV